MARYSVGAMQSTFTPSRSITSRRSAGSKRASCRRAAAPISQGAMNELRADFDHPLAAVHQQRSPSRAPNQCSAWARWPCEVALAVADRLGLAGGARGEDDQGRVLGAEPFRGGRLGFEQALVGHRQQRPVEARLAQGGGVALVGHDRARLHKADPGPQVGGAQLLGAGEGHGADAKAGHHRIDPLRAVADHGHDHVAPAHPARSQGAGHAGRAVGHLAEGRAPCCPPSRVTATSARVPRIGGVDHADWRNSELKGPSHRVEKTYEQMFC